MSQRRDDIVAEQRAQIAVEMLSSQRSWGTVTRLGKTYGLSRQAIYDIAAKGKSVLYAGMNSGGHGPQAIKHSIEVNRNRVQRGVLALTEAGVSQRNVVTSLEELLDTSVSLGWVNEQVSPLEMAAAKASRARAIENQMYIVACNRVGQSKGADFCGHSCIIDPWGEVLVEGGEDELLLTAEIDLEKVTAVCRTIPIFKDRRPTLYTQPITHTNKDTA